MIPLQQNQSPLLKLIAEQSVFKQYSFQIALINSLVLHLIVITCLVALLNQNNNKLQKPVQFTVKLIKINTSLPISKSNHAMVVTQSLAEATKSNMKQAPSQPTKNPQTSQTNLSNNNPVLKHITMPMQTTTDSLPALVEPDIESSTLANAHSTSTQPAYTPAAVPVAVSEPVIAHATEPSITPVKIGVSISASYANSNRKPEYPAMSRRLNEQGTVILKVLVTENGAASMVEVKTSSSYPLLDESARNAVMQWHFNPATIDGKPTSEFYSLAIPFKLEE